MSLMVADATIHVLGYIRVSSKRQDTKRSPRTQREEIDLFVAQRPGLELVEVYRDAESGKNDGRAQYQALLAHARRLRADGRSVMLLVNHPDRLGRSNTERSRVLDECEGIGVMVRAARMGDHYDRLLWDITAAVDSEESRRIGLRIRQNLQHAREAGWAHIAAPPWGYRVDDATAEEIARGSLRKVYRVCEIEAACIRELFARADRGDTTMSVAGWAAALSPEERGGRQLSRSSVLGALRREMYVGKDGHYPALVDREVFDRVQARLDHHWRKPRQARGTYALTGSLRCPKCGGPMSGSHIASGRAYRCVRTIVGGARNVGRQCTFTTMTHAIEPVVFDQIMLALDQLATDGPELRAAWDRLREPTVTPDRTAALARLAEIEAEEREHQTALASATRLLALGKIDHDAYVALTADTKPRLATLKAEREAINRDVAESERERLPEWDTVVAAMGAWRVAFAGADDRARSEALPALIERITPIRLGGGRYDAAIVWTELGAALIAAAENMHVN